MKYLVDSDILVDHLRGKTKLDRKFKREAVSIITQGELLYGAYKSRDPKKGVKKVELLFKDYETNILSISHGVVERFALIKAKLEKKGNRLDDFDIVIAATAIVHSLILVTRNVRHFKRIEGLALDRIK